MKNRKLPSFIALSICLELVLSPTLAMAQNTNKPSTGQTLLNGLNVGMGLYNQFRGQPQPQMPAHVATDMAELQKQQTPAPDKYFTLQNMSKVPGLMEYIAKRNQGAAATGGKPINPASLDCKTLPTTLFEAKNEVCRNQNVSMISGVDPKVQAQEAFAYYNQYSQIEKLYKNYSSKSNVGGQSFGVGCMEDAMQVMNGFFAYRLEQMDTMVAELEAATAKFVEQSEMDLKAIRESTAILNGENSKFGTEFKNTDIFDYGKRFEDPACNSMISKDDMDKLGKEGGGLMAIEKKLKADMGTTPPGSKYNAEQYLKKNGDIVQEIKKMADDVSKQANLNFSSIANSPDGYGSFLSQIGGSVNTESGVHNGLNKAFFSDLQTKFAESRKKLTNEVSVIKSELGGKGGDAIALLSDVDNDASFDAELTTLENEIKGECVNRSGIDTALGRIYDPSLSKEANKHTAAQVKKRIKAIIEDVRLSPERKLQELQTIESSSGNRYEMKMDANYETNEIGADGKVTKKTVNAASKVTPGNYFSDVIKNCETQYQVNKLNNKLSAKETMKKLRTLKKDYQKAAKQHSKDIKDEIVKKMVDCGGNTETQSSTTVASCSPAKLDMASPGFCTKAAFSCSKNMQQCSQKAQKFVKDIKDDRLKRTNNYNNNVEANRKQLVGMFDATLGKYMQEAESLRGQFGAGFVAPKDIQRDIKDGSQFDQKFLGNQGDALEIKDPAKYLEMVKANMANLRNQVEAQQKAIVEGPLKEHIELTKENYSKIAGGGADQAGGLASACLAAYDNYRKGVEKQAEEYGKAQKELGEKLPSFCKKYNQARDGHPNGACSGNVGDLTKAAFQAAAQSGDRSASNSVAEFESMCDGYNNESKSEKKKSKGNAVSMCRELLEKNKNEEVCVNYNSAKKALLSSSTTDDDVDCKVKVKKTKGKGDDAETFEEWGANCKTKVAELAEMVELVYEDKVDPNASKVEIQINTTAPAFCNAGNNSGPYNTKGGIPNMQNPLQQAAGAMGTGF